jgi:DNA polymerase-3 subunit epsilon
MNLTRPIVWLDVESTGTDPAIDRIVTLATIHETASHQLPHEWRFNPGVTMSEENIAIHGITNEMASIWQPFETHAKEIAALLTGCDLGGFNLSNFDIPIIWEELYRCGITWNLTGVNVLDAGTLFKKREPRGLSAAVPFYCARPHVDAHSALADTKATMDVFRSQVQRYGLAEKSVAELAKECLPDGNTRIDLAGILVRDKDGVARFTHKRVRGVAVKDDPGYARWILGQSFSEETKIQVRTVLDEIQRSLF